VIEEETFDDDIAKAMGRVHDTALGYQKPIEEVLGESYGGIDKRIVSAIKEINRKRDQAFRVGYFDTCRGLDLALHILANHFPEGPKTEARPAP
jgi:hypothetical protein